MNRKLFLLFLSILFFPRIFAQSTSAQLLNVVPPSPTVASLGKYGEVPVSQYTGIPNISIPLYEINDGSLHLPISLSYHAGGVKVEEVASSVGLSWTLNAGGIVGRSVRGLADEIAPWQPQPTANTIDNIMLSGNSTQISQLAKDVDAGYRDGEADIFYYNFNQFSGKFFYDQTGIIHTLTQKKLLISPVVGGGWKVTTEDGTVYTFTEDEVVRSASCNGDQSTTSAWFLTSIKSADERREITFVYETINYTNETLTGQTKYFSVNGAGSSCLSDPSPCLGTQNYNTKRLTRINFNTGYIIFSYNTTRCDLMGDKSLDEMIVYTNNNQPIKKFAFAYSYFGGNSDGCSYYTKNTKRLKLDSITEGIVLKKPPYKFTYNEAIPLPDRLSYAQDHWGYYNGKLNNPYLVATFSTTTTSGAQVIYPGADRRANPATAQAGILTEIEYPTGGKTVFTYESNTVSDNRVEYQTAETVLPFAAYNQSVSSLPNPFESAEVVIPAPGAEVQFSVSGLGLWQFCDNNARCYIIKDNNSTPFGEIGDNWNGVTDWWPQGTYKLKLVTGDCGVDAKANFSIMVKTQIAVAETFTARPVGGLRIQQIEDRPGNGGRSIIKKYKYQPPNDPTHSSGVLVNFPDYGYDLNVEKYQFEAEGAPTGPATYCSYRVRQSFPNYPLATTQGSYVGYSHVIEDLGENGESWYSFNVYPDQTQGFPFAPVENFDWRRGFMLNTKHFTRKNGDLVPVKETINTPIAFNEFRVNGIKTGRDYYVMINGAMPPNAQPAPKYSFYPTITEFYSLGQTKERVYNQQNPVEFVETVTDYTYSPKHLQLTQTKASTSGSDQAVIEEVVTNRKFPFDYTFNAAPSGSEALGIKKLQDLHVANAVVQEDVIRQNRNKTNNEITNSRVIGSSLITFKSDKPYPDIIYKAEIKSPITLSTFGTGSQLNANAFLKNANATIANSYKPAVLFISYDAKGNITEQQKANDVKRAYLWGYGNSYPVAEVTGSDYGTVSSLISPGILNDPSTTELQIRTELAKVRSGLTDIKALVTTYTHKPMVGIGSQTGPDGRTVYFEYDEFGRLRLLKDNDGKILKMYDYKF
jgi:hypothetical protein